jgi:hypothetical protein
MQVQRANASGQDVVNDIKENIEATISEDLAGGQTAKLDTSLKLLGEGDIKLFLPSDELENDKERSDKTLHKPLTDSSPHPLQDYQIL